MRLSLWRGVARADDDDRERKGTFRQEREGLKAGLLNNTPTAPRLMSLVVPASVLNEQGTYERSDGTTVLYMRRGIIATDESIELSIHLLKSEKSKYLP